MDYFIFDYSEEKTKNPAQILGRPVIEDHDDLNFDNGVRLNLTVPVIRFTKPVGNTGILQDNVLTMLGGLVISEKFKTALESGGVDNIDYYKAEISDENTGQVWTNFYVANIIGAISCVDQETSVYSTLLAFPDKVSDFEELHLDIKNIRGQKIFRMQEKLIIIIVDEQLKSHLEKADITGIGFEPAEGYSEE